MAPNLTASPAEVPRGHDTKVPTSNGPRSDVTELYPKYRREIVWPNVVMHAYFNLAALYGAYLMLTSAKVLTGVWGTYEYVCHGMKRHNVAGIKPMTLLD
jgi:stearoyl-CoA desaturase (delta-9 desaturase)